ncbi:hypothetical protein MHU86_13576 [Fragilaria crotonensis]|nr:hypothetical protein MHU86_13576 [Fragilaria crotonensis]
MLASSSTPIVCCASSAEVLNAITVFAKPGMRVLEFGSEFGEVSAHLCQVIGASSGAPSNSDGADSGTCGEAWLVDKRRSEPKSGRMPSRDVDAFVSGKNVQFIEIDELSEWSRKVPLHHKQGYDILIISVTHILGHDLYMTILALADEILQAIPNEPKAVIVKSRALSSLSKRLIHAHRLFDGTTVLPPYGNDSDTHSTATTATMSRSSQPYWIAGVKVDDYRRTIPFVVQPGDAILEVGSHFGRTTKLLDDAGRYCIGVDIGPKIIANAKRQYPDVAFSIGDAWKVLSLLKLRKSIKGEDELGYDVVYADIGGLSGSDGHLESLSLLDSLGYALEPRCIVIKSLCMRQLAGRLKAMPDIWAKYNRCTN